MGFTYLTIFIFFKNNRNKLCLIGLRIDFIGHNSTFCSNPSFTTVSFICIVFVTDNQDLFYLRIFNHLLHEHIFVLSILQIPNIENDIYTVTYQTFSQSLHPYFILFWMPTV